MYQFEPCLTDIVRVMISHSIIYYIADSTNSNSLYKRRYIGIGLESGVRSLKNNHWLSIL